MFGCQDENASSSIIKSQLWLTFFGDVKTLQYPVTDKAMPFGSGLLGMFYCPDLPSKIKSTLRLIKAS